MMNFFEFLQYPFMQRAFITGILLGGLLAYLGVFVVLRRMAFFSDGIAHASLAGVALGVLISVNPLMTALAASVFFSVLLFWLEKKTNVSSDAAIGLIFTFGMALGVLLISLKRGYQPELVGFLFGNILMIHPHDLILISILSAFIFLFLILKQREISLLCMDSEMAYLSGVRSDALLLSLYIALAMAVVLGIKILGVVLVSALLIIPVSIAKLISGSFRTLVLFSIVFSELIILAGLSLSYLFDLPAGAVIVLTGTVLFFGVFFARKS